MIDCIVLAGKSDKELNGEKNKGLININGKPMISYVLEALISSEVVDRILIVGRPEDFQGMDLTRVEVIRDRGTIIDNVILGIDYFKNNDRVLITTCDIPLLTGDAVRDFVNKSLSSKADVCYPIIDREVSESKYPDAKRTYAKLKEGSFTGGNLIIVNPKILARSIPKAKQMIEYRKNPVKMSKVLGLRFLIKFLMGRLTIEAAEKRVANILRLHPKAIITHYPEIGNDVDKPEDVEMAQKYLATAEE